MTERQKRQQFNETISICNNFIGSCWNVLNKNPTIQVKYNDDQLVTLQTLNQLKYESKNIEEIMQQNNIIITKFDEITKKLDLLTKKVYPILFSFIEAPYTNYFSVGELEILRFQQIQTLVFGYTSLLEQFLIEVDISIDVLLERITEDENHENINDSIQRCFASLSVVQPIMTIVENSNDNEVMQRIKNLIKAPLAIKVTNAINNFESMGEISLWNNFKENLIKLSHSPNLVYFVETDTLIVASVIVGIWFLGTHVAAWYDMPWTNNERKIRMGNKIRKTIIDYFESKINDRLSEIRSVMDEQGRPGG